MKFSKIRSIKRVPCDKTPVYDIEVENHHNFMLSNGLVVHNCEPYLFLKSAIYNKRIVLYDSPLLTEELLGLERNNNTGKIDHPDSGRLGSKDQSDAVCGALWNASQHSEEYAFEYGEDLINAIPDFNYDAQYEKRQIQAEFEEQLKQTFNVQPQPIYKDFGMGKAQDANIKKQLAISSGILIW